MQRCLEVVDEVILHVFLQPVPGLHHANLSCRRSQRAPQAYSLHHQFTTRPGDPKGPRTRLPRVTWSWVFFRPIQGLWSSWASVSMDRTLLHGSYHSFRAQRRRRSSSSSVGVLGCYPWRVRVLSIHSLDGTTPSTTPSCDWLVYLIDPFFSRVNLPSACAISICWISRGPSRHPCPNQVPETQRPSLPQTWKWKTASSRGLFATSMIVSC